MTCSAGANTVNFLHLWLQQVVEAIVKSAHDAMDRKPLEKVGAVKGTPRPRLAVAVVSCAITLKSEQLKHLRVQVQAAAHGSL